MIQISLWG